MKNHLPLMSMTELHILYHGVPIGTALLRKAENDVSAEEPTAEADHTECWPFCEFISLPAYEAIEPILQLAEWAVAHSGFLGPVADPASDEKGKAALRAAVDVWAELELRDLLGRPLRGRVTWMLDAPRRLEHRFWLSIELDRNDAIVGAMRHPSKWVVSDDETPAA